MTSVVKKSLYFILGFCLILPMVNNSAVARNIVFTCLTVSNHNCQAGSHITDRQRDAVDRELRSNGLRFASSPAIRCEGSSALGGHFRQLMGERYQYCTRQSIVRIERRAPITGEDIRTIRTILENHGIRALSSPLSSCPVTCRSHAGQW